MFSKMILKVFVLFLSGINGISSARKSFKFTMRGPGGLRDGLMVNSMKNRTGKASSGESQQYLSLCSERELLQTRNRPTIRILVMRGGNHVRGGN